MIPRRCWAPRLGWIWIKPLQYGDMIEAYTNRQRNPAMLAFLFRRCIVGFEHLTAHDVAMMHSWAPTILETAVVKASGLVDDEAESAEDEDEADEDEDDEIIDPEDSIWAKHNKTTHDHARDNAEELTEADLMYALHEHGETQESIYRMLLDEIDTLLEGAERHNERVEERRKEQEQAQDGPSSSSSTPSRNAGSRQDRASQVFGR